MKEANDEEKKTKNGKKKKNVFAKLEGFRWWPALLLSKKDLKRLEIENERMIRMLKLPRKKTREECECVRFHGTGDVSLLARDKIVELNEESFKAHVGESLEAFGRRSGGENASSGGGGGGGKKPSAAFLKAVEEAVRWEREHENDAASSSSSSSEGEEDNEEEEVKKEEKKARNDDSNDATSGGKKTRTTPTKNNNKKKKDEAVATGAVAVKTAAAAATAAAVRVVSAAATEKKQKKVDSTPAVETVVNDDSSRKKTTGGAAAAASKERRESGKTASTAAPATTANKKKTTTTTNKTEKESPDKAEEKMVDVKREEEQTPVKPSSVQEESKEEGAPAPIAPSSPPPPPPPPHLPLEPTKTWLEFSPIEASSFDASMMSDQENPTRNKASAVVSIAPNEDIEQSSIIVQNEQMQLEEAHLNGARLTRNQRNNNNNMNEHNKKKAREQQQQFPSNANDRNTLEGAKKSVSFAKQEKMSANNNNSNDDEDGEAQQRGVNPKTTQYGTSTLNNAKVPSAGASRGASQHLPRGGAGAVSASGGKALDSRFYKSCHQCQQQHVASPCEFGGANGSNNSNNNNNNNADTDVGKSDTGNQQQTSAASKCCGVSFCDQCVEKFYSHLTRSQCRKKCPKCRGLCNCRLCLRKEDVVGKTSSLYSSGKSSNAANNIASLFEDSENLALASLEATLGILERKKRASYCLVAMEKAFAKSAEFDAWEIEREEKKKKEEEKQSGRNSKSISPPDDNDDDDNDENAGDEDRKNNKKRKKSNVSANVPSAFCDACANDIVAVCLSCDECDVRVCAYCVSTLRKGTEAPYVERVCCLSLDDTARAKIKAELSRRILSEKPPAAEMKNTTSIAAAQKGSSGSPHVNSDASPSARKQRESTNNDENDSALLPMKKRLKMAFKTLNSSFTDGSDDDLEKKSPEKPSDAAVAQQQQQQQLQRKQREEEALAAAAALEVAKKSKLEDDIICVACDDAMKIDLRMYDFERVKDATQIAKKDSSLKVDENRDDDDDDDDVECPYCKKETNEENFRLSTLFGEKGKGTKIWTPDQKELLKAEKNALYADDAKEYNHFIAHFRYHWLRGDPVVVRNVETEMSWDPSVIERAMRDPNIASISGNLGVKDNIGLNSSGLYAASFQHDAVVPVFACGADEYDELAKMKKTSTPMKGGGTSASNANGANNAALQNKDDDAMITSVGKNEKKKRKSFLAASSSNAPKFSMALKDFFAGFFDPVLTFEGKLFQLRDFPRCIGGNRFNLKEVLPKHFRRLLAALPFRLYTNPEVGTINLFALQFQKYIRGGGAGGENFFQGVSSNSRSRGDVAAKKFVESLVKATFSYGSGTRTYVEGKSSIEMFGPVGSDDVCSVNVFSSSSNDDNNGDDKTIALWTIVRPQDAEEVLRRVEEHEDIEEDALYLTEDALRKALLPPTTTTREKDKTTSDPTARPRCFAFAQKEKECVLLPGGSLRQILNVRSNCRADVKFSSPETVSGRRRRALHQPPLVNAVVVADENDFFERRRVTVLKAAKACADVVLHEDDDSDDTEDGNAD